MSCSVRPRVERKRASWAPLAGGCDVGVEIFFGLVVAGDFVKFSAFFVEPEPRALALGVVVHHQPQRSQSSKRRHVAWEEQPVAVESWVDERKVPLWRDSGKATPLLDSWGVGENWASMNRRQPFVEKHSNSAWQSGP